MDYSLYIHLPFCHHRCHYCDFNTYTGYKSYIPAYFDALIEELRIVYKLKPDIRFHSIYFGGGTPSIIPELNYSNLFKEINHLFQLTSDCEISIEANPGTLTHEYLTELRNIGVNRLSIGVQSTDPFDLKRLDRIHSIWDVFSSIRYARAAGFDNINLDLIFGLPWQNLVSWQKTLTDSISMHPEHFSVYSLIIEQGTPLYLWYQKGLINEQDQDLEADMYESTITMLDKSGYSHYEISNWSSIKSSRDYRCRHNLQYWLGYPYLGIGAGAHGYANGYRTENTHTIEDYIKRLGKYQAVNSQTFPFAPAQISRKEVSTQTQMMDFMMVGLRLVKDGVSQQRFTELFGKSMTEVFQHEIGILIEKKLLTWSNDDKENLHLTKRGVMVANQVFKEFV